MDQIWQRVQHSLTGLVAWTARQKKRTIHCRACDVEVSLADSICPRCGAADPARVPWSAVTAICAIGAMLIVAVLVLGG